MEQWSKGQQGVKQKSMTTQQTEQSLTRSNYFNEDHTIITTTDQKTVEALEWEAEYMRVKISFFVIALIYILVLTFSVLAVYSQKDAIASDNTEIKISLVQKVLDQIGALRNCRSYDQQ